MGPGPHASFGSSHEIDFCYPLAVRLILQNENRNVTGYATITAAEGGKHILLVNREVINLKINLTYYSGIQKRTTKKWLFIYRHSRDHQYKHYLNKLFTGIFIVWRIIAYTSCRWAKTRLKVECLCSVLF